MKKSQVQRIIDTLNDGAWHCTSEFYADFMADPRRRMVDIKNRGYTLESRPCKTHNHDGQSKQWRMTAAAKPKTQYVQLVEINGKMVAQLSYA